MSTNKSEFSKILILVDGSQPSINATDSAIALAKKETDRRKTQLLIALHVVFSRLGYAYSSSGAFGSSGLATPDLVKELLEDSKKEAQQWFDKIKQKINGDNDNSNRSNIQLHTEVVVTGTSLVSAIVEYAKNKNADLIITGTRGRSDFKKLLLGSVASGVILHAACPVMVVK
ncbi:MAG TPA: universal stress protein [Nitrososphaeraceae archaeon]|nr:universal stress protein [Nitrososphaeraceae archaeon]